MILFVPLICGAAIALGIAAIAMTWDALGVVGVVALGGQLSAVEVQCEAQHAEHGDVEADFPPGQPSGAVQRGAEADACLAAAKS